MKTIVISQIFSVKILLNLNTAWIQWGHGNFALSQIGFDSAPSERNIALIYQLNDKLSLFALIFPINLRGIDR